MKIKGKDQIDEEQKCIFQKVGCLLPQKLYKIIKRQKMEAKIWICVVMDTVP